MIMKYFNNEILTFKSVKYTKGIMSLLLKHHTVYIHYHIFKKEHMGKEHWIKYLDVENIWVYDLALPFTS